MFEQQTTAPQSTGRIHRSDDHVDKIPVVQRIGWIKVGELVLVKNPKQGAKNTTPAGLDYFRLTAGTDKDGKEKIYPYLTAAREAIGPKPEILNVTFVSNDITECCKEYYELWDGPRKIGEGDGLNFKIYEKDGVGIAEKWYVADTPEIQARIKSLGKWRMKLTMRLYLLDHQNGGFGHWEFNTHGAETSIPTIRETVDFVRKNTGGRLFGVPFQLRVIRTKSFSSPRVYTRVELISQMGLEGQEKVHKLGAALRDQFLLTEAVLNGSPALQSHTPPLAAPQLPAPGEPIRQSHIHNSGYQSLPNKPYLPPENAVIIENDDPPKEQDESFDLQGWINEINAATGKALRELGTRIAELKNLGKVPEDILVKLRTAYAARQNQLQGK